MNNPRVFVDSDGGSIEITGRLISATFTVKRPAYVHEFGPFGDRRYVDYGDVIDTTGEVVEDEPKAIPEVSE